MTMKKIKKENPLPPNPNKKDDGWYWNDENGNEFGPYSTENEASEKLSDYSKHLGEMLTELMISQFTSSTIILQKEPTIIPEEIKRRKFDVELVKLLREHILSILQRLQKELKDCHNGYLLVDRKDEDCFENILKLFKYILDNDDVR